MAEVIRKTWKESYVLMNSDCRAIDVIQRLEQEGYEILFMVACGADNNDLRIISCKTETILISPRGRNYES